MRAGGRHRAVARIEREARVAVIGAGAAGLSVAYELANRGVRRVTVLERDARVGGKCCTWMHEGRSYELGAVVLTPAYVHVRRLVKELGLATTPGGSAAFVDVDSGRTSLGGPVARDTPWAALAASCARLGLEMVRRRRAIGAGMCGFSPDTFLPFGEWARARGVLEAARLVLEPLFTPLGYGAMVEVPALYVLKLATMVSAPFYELCDGYQALWEEVARALERRGVEVRRGVQVRAVRRDGPVTVATAEGDETFDAVVVTSPLDEAVRFLDATAEEVELASKIAYGDYRVVVASATGLPAQRYVYLPKHFEPAARGEVMLWHHRWKDSDVRVFYAYGDGGEPLDDTTARVRRTVRRLGGDAVGEVV